MTKMLKSHAALETICASFGHNAKPWVLHVRFGMVVLSRPFPSTNPFEGLRKDVRMRSPKLHLCMAPCHHSSSMGFLFTLECDV